MGARGTQQSRDVVLAGNAWCEIVVAAEENSAVKQAAVFLSADIEKISGYKPAIVAATTGGRVTIRLVTLSDAAVVPAGIARQKLAGQWEAYQDSATRQATRCVAGRFRFSRHRVRGLHVERAAGY